MYVDSVLKVMEIMILVTMLSTVSEGSGENFDPSLYVVNSV